jgi:hypothetical protein
LMLLMCVLKKGKDNYMHVVEIKWVFSGKFFCDFVLVVFFVCLFTIGVFCFIFSVSKGKKKFLFFLFCYYFYLIMLMGHFYRWGIGFLRPCPDYYYWLQVVYGPKHYEGLIYFDMKRWVKKHFFIRI